MEFIFYFYLFFSINLSIHVKVKKSFQFLNDNYFLKTNKLSLLSFQTKSHQKSSIWISKSMQQIDFFYRSTYCVKNKIKSIKKIIFHHHHHYFFYPHHFWLHPKIEVVVIKFYQSLSLIYLKAFPIHNHPLFIHPILLFHDFNDQNSDSNHIIDSFLHQYQMPNYYVLAQILIKHYA